MVLYVVQGGLGSRSVDNVTTSPKNKYNFSLSVTTRSSNHYLSQNNSVSALWHNNHKGTIIYTTDYNHVKSAAGITHPIQHNSHVNIVVELMLKNYSVTKV